MTTFNSYKPTGNWTTWILLAVSMLIPVLFILVQFHQWIPFRLNGRQFLAYYSIHILSGLVVTYLYPALCDNCKTRLVPVLMIAGLALAIARIIQGLYHSKPVLFLLLLTIIYLILLGWRSRNTTAGSPK